MKSDRYNNEGYADPTAYHAIESADKPNPGELWSMERANGEQLEELNRWLNAENCQPAEKIAAVTEIYNQLTIRSVCENKMREYYTLAMESLEAVAVAEEKKKELKNLVKLLMYREM